MLGNKFGRSSSERQIVKILGYGLMFSNHKLKWRLYGKISDVGITPENTVIIAMLL